MNDDLLQPKDLLAYYNDELGFIRKMGAEFGSRHPEVAARLQLEGERASADPHVERLIQAFALLTGRIQKKLDDQFPELTESFFHILYPHYLRPIPSMSVIEVELDPGQSSVTAGLDLKAGTKIFSDTVDGLRPCEFRTGYPLKLLPLSVASAGIGRPTGAGSGDAAAVIRLDLRPTGQAKLNQLPLEQLRFFLKGEDSLTFPLYELLFNSAARVVVQAMPGGRLLTLPAAAAIRPVGFAPDEALLPFDSRTFPGYRLIQEYFAFPWKFLFFDLDFLADPMQRLDIPAQATSLQVSILLNSFERPERLAGNFKVRRRGVGKAEASSRPLLEATPRQPRTGLRPEARLEVVLEGTVGGRPVLRRKKLRHCAVDNQEIGVGSGQAFAIDVASEPSRAASVSSRQSSSASSGIVLSRTELR